MVGLHSEELNRPENASLKPYVAKLKELKKTIDADGARIGAPLFLLPLF